jgi:hypothetical protein
VLWRYGDNGHAAICYDTAGTKIATTDPTNKPGGVGVEPIGYPSKWGASSNARIWTDEYNGVRFDVGGGIAEGDVYLSKLVYGQQDSDSVARLQSALNAHPLTGGEELPTTGNYYDETDEEVRLCQRQHGYGNDAPGESSVGPDQAEHLFAGTGNTVINDLPLPPEPEPPDPPDDPATITLPLGIEYHYSGKPAGTLSFGGDYKRLDVASWAPKKDGLTLGMIYANVDGSGEFRSRLIRENPSDETAYQTHYPKSGDNYLLTHVWFESGEGGRPLHYELQTMDGETMTVGTRYAKFVTIPWDVTATIDTAARAYETARRYAPALAALLVLLAFLGVYSVAT